MLIFPLTQKFLKYFCFDIYRNLNGIKNINGKYQYFKVQRHEETIQQIQTWLYPYPMN